MKPLLHPQFKLNGLAFSSTEKLKEHARGLIIKGKEYEISIGKFILEWLNDNESITVHSSGSTGKPKHIALQKQNVYNSAAATANYFDLQQNTTALLCLSADYIAGKMMLVRAMVAGWDLHYNEPDKEPLKNLKETFDFCAMVPYQAHHSLKNLKKIKKLIVGGGAVPKQLELEFQKVPTRIFATYGMTETISHIAIRPLNGSEKSVVYGALPKVTFTLDERNCLQISAPGINEEVITTNDMVQLISPTSFRFLGRVDNVINTGGVKVNPETIEEKLSANIALPFFIASEKDEALGERVILIVESVDKENLDKYSEAFLNLSAYERPKKIYPLSQFIYTETGKIKRAEVLSLLGL